MLGWVEIGVASALVGFVHSCILNEYETPLTPLYVWLNTLEKRFPMLAKPLGYCIVCFSGQLGLWSSVFITWDFTPLGIVHHFWSAATAIVVSYFIAVQWEKSKH
jgi:hypothetical protein